MLYGYGRSLSILSNINNNIKGCLGLRGACSENQSLNKRCVFSFVSRKFVHYLDIQKNANLETLNNLSGKYLRT